MKDSDYNIMNIRLFPLTLCIRKVFWYPKYYSYRIIRINLFIVGFDIEMNYA